MAYTCLVIPLEEPSPNSLSQESLVRASPPAFRRHEPPPSSPFPPTLQPSFLHAFLPLLLPSLAAHTLGAHTHDSRERVPAY